MLLEKVEFECLNLLMWSPGSIYSQVLLNKNMYFEQNHHFSLSLMICCSFFLLHMILLLVNFNALDYVDIKKCLIFATNLYFFIF